LTTEKQGCSRCVDDLGEDGSRSTAEVCARIRKYRLIYIYI